MRGMRTTDKIERSKRNNSQDVQCEPSFTGRTLSVPLIAPTRARRIADREVAFINIILENKADYVIDKLRPRGVYQAYPTALLFRTKTLLPL